MRTTDKIAARMGIDDADLKTPKHDEIMLWLEEEDETILTSMFPSQFPLAISEWPAEDVATGLAEAESWRSRLCDATEKRMEAAGTDTDGYENWLGLFQALEAWKLPEITESPSFEFSAEWERVVRTKSGFTLGFVDYVCTVEYPTDLSMYIAHEDYPGWRWKERGCADFPRWYKDVRDDKVCFEVKSKIDSLGDVMRQINLYRSELRGIYVIVSPDDRFVKTFQGQQIQFVKYPEPTVVATVGS